MAKLREALAIVPGNHRLSDRELPEEECCDSVKVGIAWQGNPKSRQDRTPSIPLAQFAPLARVPGVHLLSLQKGVGHEQFSALEASFPVTDLGNELDGTTGAFVDTAAVMKNLDLVVTSDTAIAHLAGELIDKITILEIKSDRITDAAKRHHVGTELALLVAARDCGVPRSAELTRLTSEIKNVNEALWQIEDEIRLCERDEDFGPRFIALARSVYHTNDRRAALKRRVNELFDSRLIEEKSYAS
jgi:hypothetical protein